MKLSRKVLTISFILTFIITTAVVYYFHFQNRQQLSQTVELYSDLLEETVGGIILNIDVFSKIIERNPYSLTDSELEEMANTVIGKQGIQSVLFAPNAIITHVFPDVIDKNSIGADIFASPSKIHEARIALETKETTAFGPYDCVLHEDCDSQYVLFHKPVFIFDKNGDESFWGFIAFSIIPNHSDSKLGLSMLSRANYEYQLSIMSEGRIFRTLVKTQDYNDKKAVRAPISLSNRKWELAISAPVPNYQQFTIMSFFFLGIVISLLIYVLIGHQTKIQNSLIESAETDQLTGTYNRRMFDIIEEKIRLKTMEPFTLFYLDLNKFKEINDTYGHQTGDLLLIAFSQRIRMNIKNEDILIRFGGDEFIIISRNMTEEKNILSFVHRLNEIMKIPYCFNSVHLHSSASIGYAQYPNDGLDCQILLLKADEQMYKEKQSSKGTKDE